MLDNCRVLLVSLSSVFMTSFVSVKIHSKVGLLGLLRVTEQVRVVDWFTAILLLVADTVTSGGTAEKRESIP